MPSVLVAVMAYGGTVTKQCADSLIDTCLAIAADNYKPMRTFIDMPDAARARAFAVHIAKDNKADFTLFVDADTQYRVNTLQRMFAANKPIVGCVIPSRNSEPTFNVLNPRGTGLTQCDGIGMGLCLIQSHVFDKVSDFRRIDDWSEDYSFCFRWRETRGEVWCLTDEDIGHVGQFVYRNKLNP